MNAQRLTNKTGYLYIRHTLCNLLKLRLIWGLVTTHLQFLT